MIDNIENISIVFENDVGELEIESKDIISLVEIKKADGYGKLYEKLVLEFNIDKQCSNYESHSLIFHENKLDSIIINYFKLPTVSYSLPKYIRQEKNNPGFDYELKVSAIDKGLHITLVINCILYKEVISVKPEEVIIIDENDDDKPRYNSISSLTFSCLVFKNKNKLSSTKINLRQLNPYYVVGSHRINLIKDVDYKVINEEDKLFLNEFFGENIGDYPIYLERLQKRMLQDIKKTVANRGCNLACIHAYKYRINKQEDMFNVLIEYLCGKIYC